jgi:hypothetical protein
MQALVLSEMPLKVCYLYINLIIRYVEQKSEGAILTTEYDDEGIILYKCMNKSCYFLYSKENLWFFYWHWNKGLTIDSVMTIN